MMAVTHVAAEGLHFVCSRPHPPTAGGASVVIRTHDRAKNHVSLNFYTPYLVLTTVTGGHGKQDLRYTQKLIYLSIFTNNIWSYLRWAPVT